jgi:hypothetical protein
MLSLASSPNQYDQYAGRAAGDFEGGGNFSACVEKIERLFSEVNPALGLSSTCTAQPCTFGGVHQPRFWEGGAAGSHVVRFENFFCTVLTRSTCPRTILNILYVSYICVSSYYYILLYI